MNLDLLSLCLGLLAGGAAGYMAARQALAGAIARLEAERDALQEQAARQQDGIAAAERNFALQFENLANRIFEEKTQAFRKESQDGLGQVLGPLKEKLQEFQKKIDDSFGQQAREQFSLRREIENIVRVNERMTLETENLTRALKGDSKAQGNWGEVMLEKILGDAGLRKGEDYIVQGGDMNLRHVETGRALRPDVVVMLPDDKHVVVDAKVSLTAYERYCAQEDDPAREAHMKEFLSSLHAHVKGLAERRYQDTDGLGAPDFVLMFLPIEGAYSLAVQADPSLTSTAWENKIAIVCPSTLFVSLRTVASLWRIERQNRNVEKIAREGGGLYDKVVGFVADMEALGKRIGSVHEAYESAFSKLHSGRGSITSRVEKLRRYGSKTSKRLPAALAGEDGDEEDEPPAPLPLKKAENG